MKIDLEDKSYLLWTSMTFDVILIKMKYLRIHNISIQTSFFYQNRCVRKFFFLNSRNKQTKRWCFFVRCRRTYVLKSLDRYQWLKISIVYMAKNFIWENTLCNLHLSFEAKGIKRSRFRLAWGYILLLSFPFL